MSSRVGTSIVQESVDDLSEALAHLGVTCMRVHGDSEFPAADAIVEIGDQRFAVDVKRVVTFTDAPRLQHRIRPHGLPTIIIADRIAEGARQSIRSTPEANYYDRRGMLHIVSPPVVIDAIVASDESSDQKPRGALDTQVAKEVAIVCLSAPDKRHRVREVAPTLAAGAERRVERHVNASGQRVADLSRRAFGP